MGLHLEDMLVDLSLAVFGLELEEKRLGLGLRGSGWEDQQAGLCLEHN